MRWYYAMAALPLSFAVLLTYMHHPNRPSVERREMIAEPAMRHISPSERQRNITYLDREFFETRSENVNLPFNGSVEVSRKKHVYYKIHLNKGDVLTAGFKGVTFIDDRRYYGNWERSFCYYRGRLYPILIYMKDSSLKNIISAEDNAPNSRGGIAFRAPSSGYYYVELKPYWVTELCNRTILTTFSMHVEVK